MPSAIFSGYKAKFTKSYGNSYFTVTASRTNDVSLLDSPHREFALLGSCDVRQA